MNHLTLRPAAAEDLPRLRELEQGIIESERPYDPFIRGNNVTYYDLENLINDAGSYLIVVEAEDGIIGSGYAQIRQSKASHSYEQHCYLGFIYLEPAYRGQALGKAILDALKDWGIQRGMKHFRLDVYAQNTSAIRAYEKAGFEPTLVTMELVV